MLQTCLLDRLIYNEGSLGALRNAKGKESGSNMELHQARYFLAVCNDLNFTRAAKKCNVAQPSLTRAIQLLKKEFDGYLFNRKRPSIELTDLGTRVRPYLEEFWRTASTAKQIAREYSASAPKELNLAIMCTIAPKLLLQMLSLFRTNHPEIRMQLTDGEAQVLEEKLINLQIEAAIYCRPDHREPDPRLNYLPLFKEQMMIILPEGHRLSKQHSIRIRDLAGEQYVQRVFCEFGDMIDFRNMVDKSSDAHSTRCDVAYKSDRDDWILGMVASGFGFGFLPRHSIIHDGIVARPLVDPEYWRNIHLVTVRDKPQPHSVRALVREAMRTEWANEEALAVNAHLEAN
jgi:LysR family hydrogen peroxide-inducible transcriptional activator